VCEKENRPRRELVEEEELLVYTDLSMISLRSFFEKLLMIHHPLFVWKCDSIDALQRVVLLVTTKIARGVLGRIC